MAPLPAGVFPARISTARLRLRRPCRDEHALYARQAVEAYFTHAEPLSAERGGAFAWFMIEHWERFGFGFLVAERTDDGSGALPIGHVGFKYVDAWPDHWPQSLEAIELGYSVVPSARGRGYVTEGATAALAAAFAAFDVPRLTARCRHDNPKSAAVLERCGMTEIEPAGHLRQFALVRPA